MPDQLNLSSDPMQMLPAGTTYREDLIARRLWSSYRGRENAIPAGVLAKSVGISPRQLRRIIHKLAVEYGFPVATLYRRNGRKEHGHFIQRNEAEALESYKSMLAHGVGIITRASRQIHSPGLKEISGQLCIILEGE